MAPSPSSPFSRVRTNSTALSIADWREALGNIGSTTRNRRSRQMKRKPQSPTWLTVLRPPLHPVRRNEEQFVDADVARVGGPGLLGHEHEQRHQRVARPVGKPPDVDREPARCMHQFDRHHRHGAPRHDAEERERGAGEDVDPGRAAMRQDRLPRPDHVRGVDRVARDLEGEIGLHAGRDVEVALGQHRPAPVRLLEPPEIVAGPSFHLGIRLPEEVFDHDVFGGDRGIRLEIEREMAIGALLLEQRRRGFRNRGVQAGRIGSNGADDRFSKLGGG